MMVKTSGKNPDTKTNNNPHKRMHSIVFFVVASCLTVQVLEGSFIVPYILVHFGYPDLTLHEICEEMYFIVYKNDERECNYPYPLFSEVEPWKYKDMRDVVGHPVPPRPHYKGFGFREVVKAREEREAKKAAEKAATERLEGKSDDTESKGESGNSGEPLSFLVPNLEVNPITVNGIAVVVREPYVLLGESR
jgi:hypothetical protein